MAKSPKLFYTLILLTLIVALSGCELRRDSSDLAEPTPLSDLPPTLAPLGAETDIMAEASAVPTVINVQPTATQTTLGAGDAADDPSEPVVPQETQPQAQTSVEVTVGDSAAAGVASTADNAVPSAEGAAMSETPSDESIVVDAADDLPVGGPVASNPPASGSDGSYSPAYGETSYRVQPGDTLFSIAQRYGTTVEAIVYANGLTSDMIGVGQMLNIPSGSAGVYPQPSFEQPQYSQEQPSYGYQQPQPPDGYQQPYAPSPGDRYYLVSPGDTLYRIALQFGTSIEAIALANSIAYPYNIQIGQQLIIPAGSNNFGAPAPGYYPQQQPGNGYYPQQPPAYGYQQPQQQPGSDYYSQQPGNGYYPQQPPTYGYQQPQQQPGNDYYSQQPGNGYYPQQQPDNGYYPPQNNNSYGSPGGAGTHTVAPGETLFSIAQRYGTTAEALAAANGLYNPNQIYVGQVLYLP